MISFPKYSLREDFRERESAPCAEGQQERTLQPAKTLPDSSKVIHVVAPYVPGRLVDKRGARYSCIGTASAARRLRNLGKLNGMKSLKLNLIVWRFRNVVHVPEYSTAGNKTKPYHVHAVLPDAVGTSQI